MAYLPQKLFKEIVGLIATNQNTIPVVMNDPYGLTLGPDVGHHFRPTGVIRMPANGKPLTSAEYAAAWLTYLAKQAQDGKPVDSSAKPTAEEMAGCHRCLGCFACGYRLGQAHHNHGRSCTTRTRRFGICSTGTRGADDVIGLRRPPTPSVTSTVAPSTSVQSSAPPAATTATTTSTTTTTQAAAG